MTAWEHGPDEVAARSAMDKLPKGYVITWDRDEHGQFCADLYDPGGRNLSGMAGDRDRVLKVLSEAAHEHAAPTVEARP